MTTQSTDNSFTPIGRVGVSSFSILRGWRPAMVIVRSSPLLPSSVPHEERNRDGACLVPVSWLLAIGSDFVLATKMRRCHPVFASHPAGSGRRGNLGGVILSCPAVQQHFHPSWRPLQAAMVDCFELRYSDFELGSGYRPPLVESEFLL
jgi:hypothetical protein